jgi:hypothetical protein
MIIAAIFIGIILLFLVFFASYVDSNGRGSFNEGMSLGVIITTLLFIEVGIVDSIISEPTPTAMDVYQGKTTLEYKVVDDVKVDSVVIFKNDYYGKD